LAKVDDIKNLREATGAGVMDCKKALAECGGDAAKAAEYLRAKGLLKAVDKSARSAKEGLVEPYIHMAGRLGVLVEINCETDFVARNEAFKQFAHDVAMHIAAAAPDYVGEKDVPKEIAKGMSKAEEKAYLKEKILLNQGFIKDESMTIGQLLTDLVAKTGENIVIRRFVRFTLGEEG
jgi:elongation factor Ts